MNRGRTLGNLLLLLLLQTKLFAQEDLLSGLKTEAADPGYIRSTFKSTRVINSHSVETLSNGNLDFRISHRFGKINSGAYNFFGIDQATIRLALEYGVSDWLNVGIGRSSYEKTFDGFLKAKLIKQRKKEQCSFPVSVSWFSNIAITTLRNGDAVVEEFRKYRNGYAHQVIIARKFNNSLSLQLAPILVHRNLVESGEFNDSYAVEGGGRVKITQRISVNMDYIYRLPDFKYKPYHNSLSLGVDVETGGHVFQLHVTNSQGIVEEIFATRTEGQWTRGDLFYGFNISRQFNLKRKKARSSPDK